ncbi:MAG TPA: PDZ domain-containing protein [Chitinophagales bacterium]|nr:PDZ domain-containing protein [Chitinophagales bacterium]
MNIKYTLSFPAPHTHYAEVEMHISNISISELNLKMAVWSPGSYLIREFQRNIDFVEERTKNQESRRLVKTDKNTWKINTANQSEIIIKYKTYCFEYSVRTNFVDDSHALINGAPTYLYVEGFENTATEIEIIPYTLWKNISTALPQKDNNKWIRIAKNLDELIDSPIEIGNHTSYFFDAANVSHELAIYGHSNCNIEKLIADLKNIIEVETRIFGAHPCKDYVFIIHHTDTSYGGLEHLYSSVNHITRWSYDGENYQRAISLLAHEYFHLWNVKRIRPKSLIPFNYNAENFTELLWFFEGVTSYYDDYICYRAKVTSKEDFIKIVEKNINDVLNTAGINTQTLAEASFDTWLKYYRRNENSLNAHINYYTHGAIVAMIFDFMILDATNGEKSLDNVMQQLFSDYSANPNEGITENSLLEVFNAISGIDFTAYFEKYIHTTDSLNIEFYCELLGIQLKDTTAKGTVFLGLSTLWKEGKLIISQLDKNYGALKGGLSAEDEIIAIDGFRVTKDFSKLFAHKKAGEIIDVLVSRKGAIKSYKITLTEDRRKNYIFAFTDNRSEKQSTLLKKWLN